MKKNTHHPWQQGPSELIEYALKHIQKEGDFNQRIAFLLLDIGVETLLKTFLTLPDNVSELKTPYHKRAESANGNFHELIKATKEAAPDTLKTINLSHVQFYHDIRNKLYHQGNGITISSELVNGYAVISVELLKVLLKSDISHVLNKPEIEAEKQEKVKELNEKLSQQVHRVHSKITEIKNAVLFAIEKINPVLVLPSSIRSLEGSDPIQVLFIKLGEEIPKIQHLSGYYDLALLYPQYAQQPDINLDENNENVFIYPTTEKVIKEGDSLLSNIDDLIKSINEWTENAT